MITYKPIIIPGGRRKDGTWPVYIRVTFKGSSRRLPTTLSCTAADLTRGGKIKNPTILQRGSELCATMRSACETLSPFELEGKTVDDVVAHIRRELSRDSFRLDFFAFAETYQPKMKPHTWGSYQSSLNALAAFVGARELDINSITKPFLRAFIESCKDEQTGARHVGKIRYFFERAKEKYNDEDTGSLVIPRSPFSGLPKIKRESIGQKALPLETLQKIINYEPWSDEEALSLRVSLLSFCTCGANLVDLFHAKPFPGGVWSYHRSKTGTEARVRLEPEALRLAALLGAGSSEEWWLPALHRFKNSDEAGREVNIPLSEWALKNGVEHFTFYAFRKSWGTLGRRLGIEKATIDEGLAHKGDFALTDIYAERNWELAWNANRRILDLLDWSQLGNSVRSQQPR